MRIYILDDDMDFINELCSLINQYIADKEYIINKDPFQQYDIYFLDIDLPDINGIEVAKTIKQLNNESIIIFISHREDLIFDALEVFPYYFIRKRRLKSDIHKVIYRIHEIINSQYISVDTTYGIVQINVSHIYYIEKLGHYSYIKTKDESIKVNKPLKWFVKELNDHIFEYVNQSVLINVKHIINENKEYVVMKDYNKFYYSRGRRQILRNKYINQKLL